MEVLESRDLLASVLGDAPDTGVGTGIANYETLLVTNTTGSAATLAGWIDYNRNGVLDNGTERATATVATGTTDGRVPMTFPAIPQGSVGQTYARFRLRLDAAFVASPAATGSATNGEVEDYAFSITAAARIPVNESRPHEWEDTLKIKRRLKTYPKTGPYKHEARASGWFWDRF